MRTTLSVCLKHATLSMHHECSNVHKVLYGHMEHIIYSLIMPGLDPDRSRGSCMECGHEQGVHCVWILGLKVTNVKLVNNGQYRISLQCSYLGQMRGKDYVSLHPSTWKVRNIFAKSSQ